MATDHNFKVKNGLVVEGGEIYLQGVATPQIFFNGSSDTGIDIAIKATPESLDFYEPEDNNKLHMRIIDDAGVNAVFGVRTGAGDGTLRLDGSGNLQNIGTISSGAITSSGHITMTSNGHSVITRSVLARDTNGLNLGSTNGTTAISIDNSSNVSMPYNLTVSGTLASTTQSASDNSTKVATTAYVTTAIDNIVDAAPGSLDTLNELAAALGDDANFSTTVTNSIATKLPLAGGTMTGTLNMGANAITSTGTISSGAITSSGSYTVPNTSQNGLKSANGNNFFLPLDQYNNMHIRSTTGSEYHDSTAYFFRRVDQSEIFRINTNGVDVRSGGLAMVGTTVIDSNRDITARQATFTHTHHNYVKIENTSVAKEQMVRFRNSQTNYWYAGIRTSAGIASTADFHIYSTALADDVFALTTSGDLVAKRNLNTKTGNVQINGTTVIDSSRNLTSIGTISNTGKHSSSIGSNATYSRPLLEITTSATPTQIKITTNILYSGAGATTHAHSVRISGFQYGSAQMADLQIGWHVYNNEFYNRSVTSSGSWAPTVTLAVENNKVVIHLASPGYWPKLYVESMYNAYGGAGQASGWSWTDAAISADSGTPNQTVPYKFDYGNGVLNSGGTTVIDSSRNLTNIGTISSGAITSTGDIEVRSGNKLILQRPNNAVASTISTDSTGAMILDSLNSEGFFFNNAGVNAFKIDPINATFAGTISSGAITSTGNVEGASLETNHTITFGYNSHYLQAGTGSLFFKSNSGASLGGINASGFSTTLNYQIGGTTVIDSSRNLTNIGTYSGSGTLTITKPQVTSNFATTPAIRVHPSSTTSSGGRSALFLGTSTIDNYGISLRGARLGTDGNPTFEVAVHQNSGDGLVALSIDTNRNATFAGTISSGAITSSGAIVGSTVQATGNIFGTNGLHTLNTAGNGWDHTINRNGGNPTANLPGGITSGAITSSGALTGTRVNITDAVAPYIVFTEGSNVVHMGLDGGSFWIRQNGLGGGDEFNIASNGNVSIAHDLSVSGNTIIGSSLYFGGATNQSLIQQASTNLNYMADGANIFKTYSGSWGERARIDDNGLTMASSKGISSDGTGRQYNWRALANSSTSAGYVKIARIYGSQSVRFVIELAGRSTSYGDGSLGALGYIVGQLNNDNNYDIVYYNHLMGSSEVVSEVGQVDVDNNQTDIYVQVGNFAELSAHAHISHGYIITHNTLSTSQPTGYTAANSEARVFNSKTNITMDSGTSLVHNGTTVLDSSRNLTSIGTISSGAITSIGVSSFGSETTIGNIKLDGAAIGKDEAGIVFQPNSSFRCIHPVSMTSTSHSSDISLGWSNNKWKDIYLAGYVKADSGYQIGTTTVIDSSRNLTNIGTISSGAITSSGNITIAKQSPLLTIETASNSTNPELRLKSSGGFSGEGFGIHYDNGVGDAHFQTTYAHNNASLKFYTATGGSPGSSNLRFEIGGDGNFDFNGGNFSDVGTISSGAITANGGGNQSVIKSSSDAPLIVESTDAYSGINFKDTGGNSSMFYHGASDHLYLHSAKFSVNGSTLASGYEFQVNGSANLIGGLSIGGVAVINSSRGLTNITSGNIAGNLTIDYTGNGTNDAGIAVFNDNNDWGIKIDKDGSATYGLKISADGNYPFYVTNAAGTEIFRIISGGATQQLGNSTIGNSSTAAAYKAHYNDGSYMELHGFGLVMARAGSYIRPSTNGDKDLYIGGADDSLDWRSIYIRSDNGLSLNGSNFIDASRNLQNIGTISSGAITSSGIVSGTAFVGGLYGGATGAPDARIWAVSGQYSNIGIFYNEGSPDTIDFRWFGVDKLKINLENGLVNSVTGYQVNGTTVIDSSRNGIFNSVHTDYYEDTGGNFLFRKGDGAGTTKHLNLYNSTADPSTADGNGVNGITWGQRTDNEPYYMIYVDKESYGGYNYSRLRLNWHTGIQIGASQTYGGIRFYNDSRRGTSGGVLTTSIGDGDRRIRNYEGGLNLYAQGNNTSGGQIQLGIDTHNASKWHAITGRQYDTSTESEGYSLLTGAVSASANNVYVGGGLDEQNAATHVYIKAAANTSTRNGTEIVRVTTDGFDIRNNVLKITGTTVIDASRNLSNIGNYECPEGHMTLNRTGNAPLIINRKGTGGATGSSRGELLNFKVQNAKIGRIGYAQPYGGIFYMAYGNTSGSGFGIYEFSTTRYFQPVTHTGADLDDDVTLGASGARWEDVYSTNGTIQTSDRNEKQDIQALTEAETRVATACKGLIRRYRWISSVEKKGEDARYHFGAIAQDVEDAFTAEGLDAGDYALFIRSTWWAHEGHSYPSAAVAPTGAVEKTRLGIRYNQLLAFIISAL